MQYERKSEASLWESVLMWVPMLELRPCGSSAVLFQICSVPESTHSFTATLALGFRDYSYDGHGYVMAQMLTSMS